MESRKRLYLIWIIVWCVVILGMVVSNYMRMHPNVKKGDVWVNEYNSDDPFEEVRRDTIHIIDVKGDYCLYFNNSGDTISSTKHWAVVCARKLKNRR